jgi:uncharacterized alkaline shock family protein YloU
VTQDYDSTSPPATAGEYPERGPTPVRPEPAAARHAQGRTKIADAVVAKIAALAAKEIPGVHAMGTGLSSTLGSLRARSPVAGAPEPVVTQGVGVEVGETQAAVDLDLVTNYGQSIVEVTQAVRRNVIDRIEGMTGLEVTEVNITVDDLYVEGDEDQAQPEVR